VTAFAICLGVVATALLAHTIVNAFLLRRPPRVAAAIDEPVSVLLPVRDEAARVAPCLRAIVAQQHVNDMDVLVYDDGSSDGTADVVTAIGGDRVRVLTGPPPETGQLGKPVACARLADAARGTVLVFVDADVVLSPDAVARTVQLMRATGLQFVSPYPRQLAGSLLERLVQPMLQWSWLTFLPLRIAESSPRPSLAAANGQLLVVDADAYRASGGHARAVGDVLDDLALARALRAIGARGGFADGTRLATCRMYDGARAVVDGYAKSLWCAFGSTAGAAFVAALLVLVFVVPWPLAAVTAWAWPACIAGLAGRMVATARTGGRMLPDSVTHPLSVLAFAALVGVSLWRRRRGHLVWKGRAVP
jgi:glycosyltransferase involved in cell wall biosynthesis